ncbi:MAG TPA: aspartyl protease family protein [Thermodesulfobacteriota bacterium]|nr:aspartyl protease family protein [Thermodesulfobacteriota bacterium]
MAPDGFRIRVTMVGRAVVVILIGMLLPGIALADIYYWVDDQGIQYYTTTLENVPEPYRSEAVLLSLPTSPPMPPELERTPTPKSFAKVPFTPGLPVLVSAKINGAGPITLILDTGSDRTLVAPAALQKLGISTEDAPQGIVKGVTGTSYAVTVWVQSVEVGEARVGPLLIVVHDADLKGADGLLGRDFLANFNVTMDSKEKVVTLAPN